MERLEKELAEYGIKIQKPEKIKKRILRVINDDRNPFDGLENDFKTERLLDALMGRVGDVKLVDVQKFSKKWQGETELSELERGIFENLDLYYYANGGYFSCRPGENLVKWAFSDNEIKKNLGRNIKGFRLKEKFDPDHTTKLLKRQLSKEHKKIQESINNFERIEQVKKEWIPLIIQYGEAE